MLGVQCIRDLQIQILELVETFIPDFLAESCGNAVGAIGLEDVTPRGGEVGPLQKFGPLLELKNELVESMQRDNVTPCTASPRKRAKSNAPTQMGGFMKSRKNNLHGVRRNKYICALYIMRYIAQR